MKGKHYNEAQFIDITNAHEAGARGADTPGFSVDPDICRGKVYSHTGRIRLLTGNASEHVTRPCHLSGCSC